MTGQIGKTTRKKYRRKKKKTLSPTIRTVLVLAFITFLFLILIGKLILMFTLDRAETSAEQIDQLVEEVQIPAQRGNIYDRNGNLLVQDSSAKSVNLIPKSVKEPEKVSRELSQALGVEYDKVYAIATRLENDKVQISDNVVGKNTDNLLKTLNNNEAYIIENNGFYVRPEKVISPDSDAKAIAIALDLNEDTVKEHLTARENTTQLVKGKVDNQLAASIQDKLSIKNEDGEVESTNGVELIEDKKRYYTNGNFASYILGFTGQDHEGLYGVEKTFDETLSGTKGIVYYQKDAQGNIINSQTKTIQDSVKGEDLTLSIDSSVQSATEKALENTVNEWQAKEGIAIVMKVKTGEVVAMASKPDYDLNDPYSISDQYSQKHSDDFAGKQESEKEALMWQNPAVSFIYEPGSTFKPITVSTALEEGAITPESTFNCTGSINIQGTIVGCTGVHGIQNIAQILENSCNPGLVQIINGVHPYDFYKYVYNFGFGQKTGIQLTGEEAGIVNRFFQDDGSINLVDYGTFSFGQGVATTPIQIITSLSAVVNNGNYVKPTILKSDGDESPKQIISDSTSATLREEMQGVLASKPSLAEMAGQYTMGGKTGTAEKFINGEYTLARCVTSFFCFSPVEDPEYCAMVILDEPKKEGASGAASAAPTAINILKQALIYSGSNPDETQQTKIFIPDCVGLDKDQIEQVLTDRGIKHSFNQSGEGNIVINQSIPAQSEYSPESELVLTVGEQVPQENTTIPDFTGLTVQNVNEKTKELGIKLEIQGSGFAAAQSVPPGTPIEKGSSITVRFE